MIPHLPTDEAPPFSWRPFANAAGVVALVLVAWFYVVEPDIEADRDAETRGRLATCSPAGGAELPVVAPGLQPEQEGTFVRWIARRSGEDVFVSAEFRERRLAEGADGEVATWLLHSEASPVATEPVAEKRSTWKATGRDRITREQGFLDSRFCVVKLRDEKWQTELAKENR
ncbi:MAG TPA: hypothetical protein VMZ22_10030 [Acidimicrobiales bacterium]|nr:hypothetical protein [Acidimicrobiales bacterium]